MMVVTEKQILIMLRVLEGSLTVADRTDYNMFGYVREDRIRIYNEIINQQSDRMAEIKDTEKHISERDALSRKDCADKAVKWAMTTLGPLIMNSETRDDLRAAIEGKP